jgi:hypothetical protein
MPDREDIVVATARREALMVLWIFLAAMLYTVTVCYFLGYNRAPDSLTFILGFPDWVFWGIVVPWVACVLVSYWFGYVYMTDADLGGNETADELEGDDV